VAGYPSTLLFSEDVVESVVGFFWSLPRRGFPLGRWSGLVLVAKQRVAKLTSSTTGYHNQAGHCSSRGTRDHRKQRWVGTCRRGARSEDGSAHVDCRILSEIRSREAIVAQVSDPVCLEDALRNTWSEGRVGALTTSIEREGKIGDRTDLSARPYHEDPFRTETFVVDGDKLGGLTDLREDDGEVSIIRNSGASSVLRREHSAGRRVVSRPIASLGGQNFGSKWSRMNTRQVVRRFLQRKQEQYAGEDQYGNRHDKEGNSELP
jgi:hypothetical protein